MKITRNEAFVLYRLPHADKTLLIKTDQPVSWPHRPEADLTSLQGFIFYPHIPNDNHPVWHLPATKVYELTTDELETLEVDFQLSKAPKLTETLLDDYRNQIHQIQEQINSGFIDKAILSRIQNQAITPEPFQWYQRLCRRYPQVMVTWLHIPGKLSWMTATPEVLLSYENRTLHTMSLAGTQADTGAKPEEAVWGKKEQQEQAIVTDYARNLLNHHFGCPLEETGPRTVSTGKLWHLQTDFKLRVNDPTTLTGFLYDFHPTPAISGFPKDKALQVISEVEKHDRAYYTGFMGSVNLDDSTRLYVNLRCMQLFQNQIALYLGGGITAASNADDEWQETQLKAQTLLDIIN